jgi:hypothetical protein
VLAAGVTLASVAAAGPDATKQQVAITMRFHESAFVLTPFGTGLLKRDSGLFTETTPAAATSYATASRSASAPADG